MSKNTRESEIENEVYCGYVPATKNERTYGFIDALLILSGYCIATWSYTQGAYLTGLVGFKQLLITAFAGAFLMLMIYQLPVILSARFGIDIWVWLRGAYGTKGVKVLSVIIIVINFPWYAVCCDLFASSMLNLGALFGINAPPFMHKVLQLFCVFLGTFMALRGVRAITITTRILVPALVIVGGLVVAVGFHAADPSAIWNYEPMIDAAKMSRSTAYTLALEANFAFVITLVGGMAGIPRLCKSERSAYYAGVLGQGLAGSFFVVVGAVMAIAMRLKTGVESTDPTEMLGTLASPPLALCSLLLVAFANIGTQAVGSYLYGVTLKSAFPKARYKVLVGILAGYVTVLCLWGKIVEYFGTFLTVSAYIYAPFAAILFVDFFWVRRQKLDFKSAYGFGKAYEYTNGFNIAGLVCLLCGCLVSLSIYNPISGKVYAPVLFKLTPTGLGFLFTALLYFLVSLLPPVRRYISPDTRFHPITKPFDSERVPPRQPAIVLPVMHTVCRIATAGTHLTINRSDRRGIKPPYLLLGTHQSFTDFYVTPLATAPDKSFAHRENYISELEGFELYGEFPYRMIGCLGTRKFVADMPLMRNIKRVLDRGDILAVYPEARYANVGTNTPLPRSMAMFIKRLGYPVVVLNMKGNYLQQPIWDLRIRKEARLTADMTYALTREEIKSMTSDEILSVIQPLMDFDEYAYQRENDIRITVPWRAEGLHMPLYRCDSCGREFVMRSEGSELFCTACGRRWQMDELGTLRSDGSETYIPDWYERERQAVNDEIDRGGYGLDVPVRVLALPNGKNFIDCGKGHLTHDIKGFTLSFTHYDGNKPVTLTFTNHSMPSIHTEYNYRGMGQCVTLSTTDNTYFLFPESPDLPFNATKIQFAVEYLK